MKPCHLRLWVAGLALGICAGCASHAKNLASVRQELLENDIDGAVEQFEEQDYKDSDLLYLLERGHVLHLAGRWEESNLAFEAAELRADELYTRSITRQTAALVTSDNTLPYRGTAYELQFVPYYRALNYIELGRPAEALVEARKANHKLAQYGEATDEHDAFRQDAFLQYFTGLLYESEREVNDAAVSFRDASSRYRQYQAAYGVGAPTWLAEDYFAAATHLGLGFEVDSLRAADSSLPERTAAHDDYNLIVFFETGFVPYLEPVDITLPIYEIKDGQKERLVLAESYVDAYGDNIYAYEKGKVKLDHVLRFSFPAQVEVPSAVWACELELGDGRTVMAEPALNLAAVARADFQRRLPGILLKTVARALVKEAARKTAKKEDETLGWLVNAFTAVTEQADTRGWIFLPGQIHMLKTRVAPGPQKLLARYLDGEGKILDEWELEVDVPSGRHRFVAVRSFK
jgi:hypothetical protein